MGNEAGRIQPHPKDLIEAGRKIGFLTEYNSEGRSRMPTGVSTRSIDSLVNEVIVPWYTMINWIE